MTKYIKVSGNPTPYGCSEWQAVIEEDKYFYLVLDPDGVNRYIIKEGTQVEVWKENK